MKEIKDNMKYRNKLHSHSFRTNIVKIFTVSKATYRYNAFPWLYLQK